MSLFGSRSVRAVCRQLKSLGKPVSPRVLVPVYTASRARLHVQNGVSRAFPVPTKPMHNVNVSVCNGGEPVGVKFSITQFVCGLRSFTSLPGEIQKTVKLALNSVDTLYHKKYTTRYEQKHHISTMGNSNSSENKGIENPKESSATSPPTAEQSKDIYPKWYQRVRRVLDKWIRWVKTHLEHSETEDNASLSMKSIAAAVTGNVLVCLAKFVAAQYSGSGVLFAETQHSLADVVNQTLLMVGVKQSSKAPSPLHPYGFGPARFAYALVSATGVFFLGCGVSCYHAFANLLHLDSHTVEVSALMVNVLIFSLLVESSTCLYAMTVINKLRKQVNMSFQQYLKEGSDTSAIAVVVEDLAAVGGLLVAIAALAMREGIYDIIGTFIIGIGMGVMALFLIRRNMNILIGKSFSIKQQQEILEVQRTRPSVQSLHDMKTISYGDADNRFKAEIQFDGTQLVKQVQYGAPPEIGRFWKGNVHRYKRKELPNTDGALAGRYLLNVLQTTTNKQGQYLSKREAEQLVLRVGQEVVHEIGREVDRVEHQLKLNFDLSHVDLECHIPVMTNDEPDMGIPQVQEDFDFLDPQTLNTAEDIRNQSLIYYHYYDNQQELPVFAADGLYAAATTLEKPLASIPSVEAQVLNYHVKGKERKFMLIQTEGEKLAANLSEVPSHTGKLPPLQ